jgi:hypothetical protein
MASIEKHGVNFKLTNGSYIPLTTPLKNQVISMTDIISEGPIEGLPYGAASIYLDNAPAATLEQAGVSLSSTGTIFTLTSGSTAVSISNLPQDLTPWAAGGADGDKYLVIRGLATNSLISAVANDSDNPLSFTLTSSSDFFYNWMLHNSSLGPTNQPYITLKLTSAQSDFDLYARINSITSTTVAKCTTVSGIKPFDWVDTSGNTNKYILEVHAPFKIASISADALILDSSTNTVSDTFSGDISDSIFNSDFTNNNVISDTKSIDGFSYQFRRGTLGQTPVDDVYEGSGATSITASINQNLDYPDSGSTWPLVVGVANLTAYTKTSSQMALSSSTARQVDLVKMVFSYPAGLISKGVVQWYDGLAAYLIEIAIDKGDGFGSFNNINPSGEFTYHVAATSSSFFLQEDISLDAYKPFNDFKIRITRASRDDLGPKQDRTYDQNNSVILNSVWTSTTCIIRERLNHPYTALAQVRCNAKQFKSIPKRSYECKGRLIQIPSNYVTRDQSTNGIAHYRRVSSNGAIHATDDQDWDGSFRDLQYTDNPAWVFYDIVTHNRYGLGTWIETSDIDKYALYRIARYCDELVPDGKGGTEPRFLANIYLAKATEAYKVLKDMATTFRAILFWSEGNILPVIDQARDPIYNFTKGNVIDGKFNYEGTGSKLRSNQVAVTWNNPDNDYVPEALLVEDRENIVKTGKIIIEEAVAFGATSIGQATRYGRWKLWTAINQTEVVSFKTAISGAFIGPGDIINIQDADRYDTAYSGRISTTGTLSTTVVPLDRTIVLNSGSVYELSVLIQEPAARLAQDTATISTVVYNMGDIIPGSYTEETASNIQDDDDTIVQIVWAPYTHVQSKTVSTSSGSVTSLTVSAAFSYAPDREAIWLLKETVTSSGLDREGSKKMYKILGITESKKNEFGITAVEHFNEKFDAVDEDFGRPYVDTLLAPAVFVPSPTNLGVDIGD